MAIMPTMDELAKALAYKAMHETVYEGKTLSEWVEQIKSFRKSEDDPHAEEIYYLLTNCKCPIYFRNNAETYEAAKWLASKGVVILDGKEPPKEE